MQPQNPSLPPVTSQWPTTPATPTPTATPAPVGTGVAIPNPISIDPNASAVPQAQPQAATSTNPTPANTVPTQGAPSLQQQELQDANDELEAANRQVSDLWGEIGPLQSQITDLQSQGPAADPTGAKLASATNRLNTLYNSLTAAENRVETAATKKQTALDSIIKSGTLDPAQVQAYQATANKANADADAARQNSKILTDGAQGQRDLAAAQAANQSMSALAQKATADSTNAKTPAEVAALQSQASLYQQQANQIGQLIGTADNPGPLIRKANADATLTEHQVGLTDANSANSLAQANLYQAQADNQKLIGPSQVALNQANAGLASAQGAQLVPAEAANQASQAAVNQAQIAKAQLGPMYGLSDQVAAIRSIAQQVFGSAPPGADLDALRQQADDMVQQYVRATVGGTTPYAASVAAQNAEQNIFGTQAAMANQASQAAASRANALTGYGANALATLAAMNANAPKGSTAMAGAWQDVMQQMQSQLQNNPQTQVPTQPTAPQLPAFLAGFAQPAGAGAGPGLPMGQMPQPASSSLGGTTAPVTINIGGQSAAPPAPAQTGVTPVTPVTGAAPRPFAQSGLSEGRSANPMPTFMQGMQPASVDYVHQLWGNELSSGAVTSPFARAA